MVLIDSKTNSKPVRQARPHSLLHKVVGRHVKANGNIYFVPWASSTSILVLNPTTGVTSNFTGSASYSGYGWQGGVLAPNGNIYMAPYSSGNILKITFSGLSRLPASNYCLSAYKNKT